MDNENRKPTLLIVDDSPLNIKVMNELLRNDYIIRVATNGERALQIASSDAPPDLILLDVMLPGIDGYTVCKRLKDSSGTRDIPVIFITAKVNEEDEIKGFGAGAIDFITKPFRPVVVEARVRTHAELKIKTELLQRHYIADRLTGIANRRYFNEYLETVWTSSAQESAPVSLILMDIDHFKSYNDNYGYLSGDDCLIRIAKCLASSTRRKTEIVARYGDDEFACILPKTNLDGAVSVSELFHNEILSLQIPHVHSSVNNCISISQGVATIFPSNDSSPEALIKMADQALYRAKESGRNMFCT